MTNLQHIANRIDGFVSKDPRRVVDMWSKRKADFIHDRALSHLWPHYQSMDADTTVYLLDAGCGTGEIVESLKRNQFDVSVTGFDISMKAVEEAERRYPMGHTWHCGTIGFTEFMRHSDLATCLGPFAYTQGSDKWDCFTLLPKLMAVATHGVGYFMYTDKLNAKPGKVFTRFHPDEVAARFPQVKVIIEPELIADYVSGTGYEDLDKGLVVW